jgi:membrane protein DedA with SNARE-associated domain
MGLTVAGCAIWAAGFILIGMATGNAWAAIGSVLGKVLLGVGVTVLVLTLGHRRKG